MTFFSTCWFSLLLAASPSNLPDRLSKMSQFEIQCPILHCPATVFLRVLVAFCWSHFVIFPFSLQKKREKTIQDHMNSSQKKHGTLVVLFLPIVCTKIE